MSARLEFDILQSLVPDLEAQGYDVFLHPNARLLPAFFGSYAPDAIAIGKDTKLAIEVRIGSGEARDRLESIRRLFDGQDEWELRVIVTSAGTRGKLPKQPLKSISDWIHRTDALAEEGETESSLLTGWATFEALARTIAPADFERPQTPGRLVQFLAQDGRITPSEADVLRALAEKQNRFIHGDLRTNVTRKEMARFVRILRSLVETESTAAA